MISDLVRIHHAEYQDDIPFWINQTDGLTPLLEVGCGHGRVTLPLVEAGRTMVGLDRDLSSLNYLRNALELLEHEVQQRVKLVNADILTFTPGVLFGGVIIPCNTYSTFNGKDRTRLLSILHSCLKEGGLLIISLPNPQQTEKIFNELSGADSHENPEMETMITHPETGFPVQVSSRVRCTSESLLWDWVYDHLHPNGRVEREVVTVEHFPVSREEIIAELERENFRDLQFQGDYYGEQFSDSSPYLILICRK